MIEGFASFEPCRILHVFDDLGRCMYLMIEDFARFR